MEPQQPRLAAPAPPPPPTPAPPVPHHDGLSPESADCAWCRSWVYRDRLAGARSARTPEGIVRKVSDDLRKVLAGPQLQKRLLETGPAFEPLDSAELTRFILEQQKFWLPLAKKYAT
jgi:hypothetical protein